jgi:hypothetical protein
LRLGVATLTPNYPIDVQRDDGGISIFGSADIVAFSDARLKDDIRTVESGLEKILSIRGVTYVRKDLEYKERMMGVIAQEILPYIPEVVHQNVDGRYSVAYSNMIAVLIEAIKDLNKKIENLEEQLENLL